MLGVLGLWPSGRHRSRQPAGGDSTVPGKSWSMAGGWLGASDGKDTTWPEGSDDSFGDYEQLLRVVRLQNGWHLANPTRRGTLLTQQLVTFVAEAMLPRASQGSLATFDSAAATTMPKNTPST